MSLPQRRSNVDSDVALTPDAPPRSTRQLLDELDSLMEKMLTLPVDDDGSEVKPRPTKALAATLTLLEPEPEEAESAIEHPVVWAPPETIVEDEVVESDEEPEPVAETHPPVVTPLQMRQPQIHNPSKSDASWVYVMALSWERGFRRWTRPFGIVGSFARSGPGRFVIGLAGIALWVASLYWLFRGT